MSKKSRFRGPFGKQHGKRAEASFKSALLSYSLITAQSNELKKVSLIDIPNLGTAS